MRRCISFLTDDIIAMPYVEIESELRKVLAVVKMRGSDHSRDLRSYELTSHGLEVRDAMTDYHGVITAVPERRTGRSQVAQPELSRTEASVLDAILRVGETSAEDVSSDTGVPVEQIRHAIGQLLAICYVRAVARDQTILYRASPRSLR